MGVNTVAVIQARMGSTRLPGKVLRTVLGRPLLGYLIERVAKSKLIDLAVVATTCCQDDKVISDFCRDIGVACYRGSEDDVLSRFYDVAQITRADIVVRLCADSPLIDHRIIDEMVSEYLSNREGCDYYSNTIKQTYPLGMNIEIFNSNSLKTSHSLSRHEYEKEHVTPYIYTHPESFRICHKHFKSDMSGLRLTVDEEEDFQLVKQIIERLYENNKWFSLNDVIDLYESDKKLFSINSHIKQNTMTLTPLS